MRFPDFNDEWTQTTLGEIAEINPVATESIPQRFQYIDLESVEQGRIVKNNILTKDEAPSRAQRVLSNGDVIFQMVRPYQQNNLYFNLNSNIPVVASTGYAQLRGFQSSHFLYYAVHTPIFLGEVLNRCTGSNYPAINSTDLSAITLALPSPAEQKRIADFLSLIDERIQSCSETLKERKREKAGLLNQLFSQKLRFPDFNDEWTQTTLGEIGKTYTGLSGKSSEDFGKGSPYITYKMVYDGVKINLCNTEYVYVSETEKQNQVRLGDILFTTSSETPEETGLCSVLLSSCDELYLNSFCFGYRLNEENLATSIFLGYALRSPIYRMKLSTLAQGSTRYNISKSEVMRMPISLPTLEEQKKIADFLSLIDERIEVEEQLLKKYEEQKKYLLRNMFV